MRRMGAGHGWDLDSESSRLLIDVAAGRSIHHAGPLTEGELVDASRHGLLGLMALSDDPLISEAARGPYVRLAARQQAMEGVLRSVLERLARADIPATVVKGPALAHWGYRQSGHRTFTDLDLLVPPGRVTEVLNVLDGDERTVAVPPKTPKADKRNIPMISESGVRFTLDLHWDLFSYRQLRGCAAGAVGEGWSQATWDPDHALGPMWVLPPHVLMAFLATHALLDHRFRLILFRDLLEIATQPDIDWDAYLDLSRRYMLRSTGYLAWRLARSILDAPIPEDVLSALRPRNLPVRAGEMLLPGIDPVTFDGHRPHPMNLAIVLLHDRRLTRLRLAAAAPAAYPEWLRRVAPPGQTQPRSRRRPRPRPTGDRPRVLHLLPLDLARGAQTYARAMREELDGDDVEHRTATIFGSDPISLGADFDLGTPAGWGRGVGFSVRALIKLWSFLRDWGPDVVIAHGGEALKYAALAVPRRTRLIYYKIGASTELRSHSLRRAVHRLLIRRAGVVGGVSQEMVAEAIEMLGVSPSRTTYIPNARDPDQFPEVDTRSGDGPVQFISVGHVNTSKRPQWFVRAIEELQARGVECRGRWVGDGPLLEDLRSRAGDFVEFLGRRDDVARLLSDSDVFLMMSVAEGMPGVLIEAGLAGIPSIATEAAGVSDVVKTGTTGFVVAPDDWDGFVEAAEQLARDGSLRERMGKAAHEHTRAHFNLEASAALWRREIHEILRQSRS